MGGVHGAPEWRFHQKYLPEPNSGCWLWTDHVNEDGYGGFWDGQKQTRAHQFAYITHVGPVPGGCEIDHKCGVRSCVNPDHLEAVPHIINVRRGRLSSTAGAANRAKTHCPRGHPYAGDNLYRLPNGGRQCKQCKREALRRFYARKSNGVEIREI